MNVRAACRFVAALSALAHASLMSAQPLPTSSTLLNASPRPTAATGTRSLALTQAGSLNLSSTADGNIDSAFNAGGVGRNSDVLAVAMQADAVCSGVPDGIISWWPGEGNAQDIVGLYDGALQNGAMFGTGMVGQAFSLDGIDDSVMVGDTPALNPAAAITVEAWVKPTGLPVGALAAVVTKWGFDATIDSYFLGLFNDGGVVRVIGAIGDGATGDSGFSGGTVTLNAWNHIAMTYDAATGLNRLYVNGVSVSQRVRTNGIYPTTSRVVIGGEDSNNHRFFSGLIDEATLYSRALTDAEILAIYNAGGSGKCAAAQPHAPVANAGPDQTSSTGFVQLDGTASFDPDGDAILFEWSEGATSLGRGPTLAINLGEGQHTITLAVTDSTGRTGTDTVLVTVTISQTRSVTALSLVASPNPATVGGDVTLTATVSSAAGVPGGEVLFTLSRGSRVFPLAPPVPLNAGGVATLLIPGSALAGVGSALLGAEYAGNASYLPSQSTTTLTVVQAATQTRLTSSSNPSLTTGPPVLFADIITDSAVTASGKVEFFSDGVLLCGSTVFTRDRRRMASCGGAPLLVGVHTITATYSGDQNFLASDAVSLIQTVRPGTYRTIDLGFGGEAAAISPNGYVAGNSPITLGGAAAYFYDGTAHPIPSLGGGSQAVGVSDAGHVFGTSVTGSGAAHAFEFMQGVTTDRGTLGGASSLATASNSSGAFVGVSQNAAGETHGFVTFGGELTDLGTLGGALSAAKAISENGSVVGVAALADGTTHAVLFGNQSPSVDLGTLGGASSIAATVNNAAEVAGTSDTSNPSFVHAFIWRPDGGLEDLGTLLGFGSTRAAGMNDAGQVVGIDDATIFTDPRAGVRQRRAFLYANGSLRNLGQVSTTNGFVSGINNAGMVIGGSDPQAFASNGVAMTDLATLGGARSAALAINDAGQIVGWSENAAGTHRATMWTPAGPTDLVVDAADGQEDGIISLRATLTSFGEAAVGRIITFSLNGRDVATAATDASGLAAATVTMSGIAVGTYPNGVGARFAGDLHLVAAEGSASLTVRPAPPDLIAFKSIVTPAGAQTQATATIGDLVTFRLVASNIRHLIGAVGPTVGPTILTDVLPGALTFVSAGSDPRCSAAGQTVSCNEPRRLALGEGVSFDIVARVNPISGAGTRVPVVNTVHATTDGDSDFGNDSASATLTVLVPDVSLTMQVRNINGGTFAPSVVVNNGAQLEIRWTLAASTATAASVDISDALPAGLTFVRTTSGPPGLGNFCSGSGQAVRCHMSGLAPGVGATFTFVVAVNADVTGSGQFVTLTNTALVSNDDADPSNNSASVIVNVERPDVSVRMTVGPPAGSSITVNQNEQLDIDLYVSASAPVAGTVFVRLTIPSGLTYDPTNVGGPNPNTNGVCIRLASATGFVDSCQMQLSTRLTFHHHLRLRASANLNGTGPVRTLTATAQLTSSGTDGDPGNNSDAVTVNVRRPDVAVRMTVGPAAGSSVIVDQGAELDVDIYVSVSASGDRVISLSDALPAELTFVQGSGLYASRCSGTRTISCTFPMTFGQTSGDWHVGLRVRASANLAGTGPFVSVTNTASAGGGADADPSNNAASITVNVRRPDITLALSARRLTGSGANVNLGDELEINVLVTASSPGAGTISLRNLLPTGLTRLSTTTSNNFVSCTFDDCRLSSGPSTLRWGVNFRVRVTADLSGTGPFLTLTDTARVSGAVDADPSNNTASVTVTINRPDVSVRMTTSRPGGSSIVVEQGSDLDINIAVSVSSLGSGTIHVGDLLPAGITFVRGNGSFDSHCDRFVRVSCSLSPTAAQLSWNISFRVRVSADLAGTGPFVTLTNTAHVGATFDGDPSNNSASIALNIPRPNVSLFMGIRESGSNGAFGLNVTATTGAALEIEWRVAISSAGIVPITVTDTLPAGLTFVGTTSVSSGSQCGSQGQIVTCQITSTTSTFWIFRFLVGVSTQLVAPDTLIDTAVVSANSDADPSDNSASVTVNVRR